MLKAKSLALNPKTIESSHFEFGFGTLGRNFATLKARVKAARLEMQLAGAPIFVSKARNPAPQEGLTPLRPRILNPGLRSGKAIWGGGLAARGWGG